MRQRRKYRRAGPKDEDARVTLVGPRGRVGVGDTGRPDDAQVTQPISSNGVLALLERPVQDAKAGVTPRRDEECERLEKQVVCIERRDAANENADREHEEPGNPERVLSWQF